MCVILLSLLPRLLVSMDQSNKSLQSTLNKRLIVAAQTGTPTAIEALLNAGARVPCIQHVSWQQTLVRVAISKNNIQAALYLIAQVPDINTADDSGDTLLHVASENPLNSRVLEALLKRDAQLEDCNKRKQTPLAKAYNHGNKEAIKALIEAGADTDILVDDKKPQVMWNWLMPYSPYVESRNPRLPLFTALESATPSIIEAVITSVTPLEVRHILPSCILFIHRKIVCGSIDIGKTIVAKLMQEVICTKMIVATAYLQDDSEDALRAAVIESIHRVIRKSPCIRKSSDNI